MGVPRPFGRLGQIEEPSGHAQVYEPVGARFHFHNQVFPPSVDLAYRPSLEPEGKISGHRPAQRLA